MADSRDDTHLARITIEKRFCGPPNSGNGGYVCGRLAHYVGEQATVRLLQPPPLDTPLDVYKTGDTVELRDGQTAIARAVSKGSTVEPRTAPDITTAQSLRQSYAGLQQHAFPTCFVCGTDRNEGDGLRIFPGKDPDDENHHFVACDWTPHSNLCDADGSVMRHFVWAALDCPSGWAFLSFEKSIGVLGEFSVALHSSPRCGEGYVVAGWEIAQEGRKRFTASALYAPNGAVLATGTATWIVIESA